MNTKTGYRRMLECVSLVAAFSLIVFTAVLFFQYDNKNVCFNISTYYLWLLGCLSWLFCLAGKNVPIEDIKRVLSGLAVLFVIYVVSDILLYQDFFNSLMAISGICLFFSGVKRTVLLREVFCAFMFVFVVCLGKACIQGYQYSFQSRSIKSFFFNSGFYANYLVSLLPLIFSGLFYYNRKKLLFAVYLLVFGAATFVLVLTGARAAMIGFVSGCLIVLFLSRERIKIQRRVACLFITAIALLTLTLGFGFKSDSTNGRITIYRVSANIIKDHWFFGAGPQRFPVVYNDYQSRYFEQNNVPAETQILADNTFEAFNSILQILVEYGILGVILLAVLVYFIFRRIRISGFQGKDAWLERGSFACIWAVIIASLFSNPFHVSPVILVFLFHLMVIKPGVLKSTKPLKTARLLSLLIFMVFSCTILIRAYNLISSERKWHTAAEIASFQDFASAKPHYEEAAKYLNKNGLFLFNYGSEAFMGKDYDLSIKLLEESRKYISISYLYSYLGDGYFAKRDFARAEKNYLFAAFMVPSHLLNKYKLIMLYKETGDLEKRNFWKKLALTFPVKIRSSLTDEIIAEIRKMH